MSARGSTIVCEREFDRPEAVDGKCRHGKRMKRALGLDDWNKAAAISDALEAKLGVGGRVRRLECPTFAEAAAEDLKSGLGHLAPTSVEDRRDHLAAEQAEEGPVVKPGSPPVDREITFSIAPGFGAPWSVKVARSPLPIEKREKLWKRFPPEDTWSPARARAGTPRQGACAARRVPPRDLGRTFYARAGGRERRMRASLDRPRSRARSSSSPAAGEAPRPPRCTGPSRRATSPEGG